MDLILYPNSKELKQIFINQQKILSLQRAKFCKCCEIQNVPARLMKSAFSRFCDSSESFVL